MTQVEERIGDAIEAAMNTYRAQHSCDVDGAHLPLMDLLTPAGETVAAGKNEIHLLADHVFNAVIDVIRTPSPASPSPVGEGQPLSANAMLAGLRAYVQAHPKMNYAVQDGITERIDAIVAALAAQAPKPDELMELRLDRDAFQNYLEEIRAIFGWQKEPREGLAHKVLNRIRSLEEQAPKPASAGDERLHRHARRLFGLVDALLRAEDLDHEQAVDLAHSHGIIEEPEEDVPDGEDVPYGYADWVKAIAAEADTAKDAKDIARYSADDFVAPPPSEWSEAGQRRLVKAIESHKANPHTADTAKDQQTFSVVMNGQRFDGQPRHMTAMQIRQLGTVGQPLCLCPKAAAPRAGGMSELRPSIVWLARHASSTYPTWLLWVVVSVTLTIPIGLLGVLWGIASDMATALWRTVKYEWHGFADYYRDVGKATTVKVWRQRRDELWDEMNS